MIASPKLPATLAVSIVVFHPDLTWLDATLASLAIALDDARTHGALSRAKVFLVDNGTGTGLADSKWQSVFRAHFNAQTEWITADILAGHGNGGYGVGNNFAFARAADVDYLLALNPDVKLDRDAITQAILFLANNGESAMVTPVAMDAQAAPLYLVKSYPRLLTLAIRGFAPEFVRRRFQRRLDIYDRRDVAYNSSLSDARIVSGCFMFMRTSAFVRAGGFDPRFFLYFEDFDLSYRVSEFATVVRLPACRIVHGGGQAARKGWRHVCLFIESAARFFMKHGWKW